MKFLMLINLIAMMMITLVIGVGAAMYVLELTVSFYASKIIIPSSIPLIASINHTAMLLVNPPDFCLAITSRLPNNDVASETHPKCCN
jgi:hypothetical protein